MRITTLIALASFGLARAAPGADTNDSGKLDQTLVGQDTSIVPNAWIVQLDATEDLARLGKRAPWSRRKGDDLDGCKKLFSNLDQKKVKYDLRHQFDEKPDIFYGASIDVSDSAEIEAIRKMPNVMNVWPVHKFIHPDYKPEAQHPKRDFVEKRAVASDIYPPHEQLGINRLQSQGLTGKGVKVGILDYGVDYLHPALGGCFGPGCKIAFGYDVLRNSADPYDDCPAAAHGTSVTGIIGANRNETGFLGVAPDSTLGVYRVFGCQGESTTDALIQGLLRAARDGVDIINLSGGSAGTWTSDAVAVVADNVVKQGITVIVAAGNFGNQGQFYVDQPATGKNVLSVGSSAPRKFTQFTATITNNARELRYYGSHAFVPRQLSLYVLTKDTTQVADGCTTFPASTPDLSGNVVLIRRGGCAVIDKILNAAAKGAAGVLIYNQPGDPVLYEDGALSGYPSGDAGLLSADDGEYLVYRAKQNWGTNIQFNNPLVGIANQENPGQITELLGAASPYGPTYDMYPVPRILAPGEYILSTFPRVFGYYSYFSGSSFATPFVSGAAALYVQQARMMGKDASPKAVMQAFTTTARPVSAGRGPVTVSRQGAGILDAFTAVTATTSVDNSFLLLNDTNYFQGNQQITLRNDGKDARTYNVLHVPAITSLPFQAGIIYPLLNPDMSGAAAQVDISNSNLSLQPGASTTVSVRFTPPAGLNKTTFPIYSGYIYILSNDAILLKVPYLGMAAAMRDMSVIDTGAVIAGATLPLIADGNFNIQSGEKTYTFMGASVPSIFLRLVAGTPSLILDVQAVPAAVPGSRNAPPPYTVGTFATANYVARNPSTQPASPFQVITQQIPWDGTANTATGRVVLPNGSYRLRLFALKITGNPDVRADYESWSSPLITIAR